MDYQLPLLIEECDFVSSMVPKTSISPDPQRRSYYDGLHFSRGKKILLILSLESNLRRGKSFIQDETLCCTCKVKHTQALFCQRRFLSSASQIQFLNTCIFINTPAECNLNSERQGGFNISILNGAQLSCQSVAYDCQSLTCMLEGKRRGEFATCVIFLSAPMLLH